MFRTRLRSGQAAWRTCEGAISFTHEAGEPFRHFFAPGRRTPSWASNKYLPQRGFCKAHEMVRLFKQASDAVSYGRLPPDHSGMPWALRKTRVFPSFVISRASRASFPLIVTFEPTTSILSPLAKENCF